MKISKIGARCVGFTPIEDGQTTGRRATCSGFDLGHTSAARTSIHEPGPDEIPHSAHVARGS